MVNITKIRNKKSIITFSNNKNYIRQNPQLLQVEAVQLKSINCNWVLDEVPLIKSKNILHPLNLAKMENIFKLKNK